MACKRRPYDAQRISTIIGTYTMNKKSILKSLLVISLLGTPQKTKSIVGPATITLLVLYEATIIPLFYLNNYITDNFFSENTLKNKKTITQYTLTISHVKKSKYVNATADTTFHAKTPEQIISTFSALLITDTYKDCSCYISPSITFQNGTTVKLGTLYKKKSDSLEKIEKKVTQRITTYDDHYKGTIVSIIFFALLPLTWLIS